MNFLTSKPLATEIIGLFKKNTTEIKCAVAFWGESEDIKHLLNCKVKIKIICNLESGSTNPFVIEKLINKGVEIKTYSKLHAKTYGTNERLIVCSANFSTNGLGDEEKFSYWEEAGILTKNKNLIIDFNLWFDKIWNDKNKAQQITSQRLERAKEKWNTKQTRTKSLFDINEYLFMPITSHSEIEGNESIATNEDGETLLSLIEDGMDWVEVSKKHSSQSNVLGRKIIQLDISIDRNNKIKNVKIYPKSKLCYFSRFSSFKLKNKDEKNLLVLYNTASLGRLVRKNISKALKSLSGKKLIIDDSSRHYLLSELIKK